MVALAFLLFVANVLATGWAMVMVAETIANRANPTIWFLLAIASLGTIAWLGQYVASRSVPATAHAH